MPVNYRQRLEDVVDLVSEELSYADHDEVSMKFSRALAVLTRHPGHAGSAPAALRFLDFGSGAGRTVRAARRFGFGEARGYEPSRRMRDFAERHADVSVVSSIDDLPRNHFDLIFAEDVLEHCLDPNREIAAIAGLLRESGVFYCAVPTHTGFAGRVLGQSWWCAGPADHLQLYALEALKGALRRGGLVPEEAYQRATIPWFERAPADAAGKLLARIEHFITFARHNRRGWLNRPFRRGDYATVYARKPAAGRT
jgi:SAM-dependent methyltransferase